MKYYDNIKFNDPISNLFEIINNLYPGISAEIEFDPNIDGFGVTCFPDDGSIPIIKISPQILYEDVLKIIAHEIAHVIAGSEADHGDEWEAVFDKIQKKWIKKINNSRQKNTYVNKEINYD